MLEAFMKLILSAIYGMVALFALLCGWFYPVVMGWSYLAAGACGLYGMLSLIVAVRSMADAGKIAAWCWHGLSGLMTLGLLLLYVLREEGGWFLAAAALTCFTVLVTLVLARALKPDNSTNKQRVHAAFLNKSV
jgi:FtsH-binding integral membrane protein